MDDSEDAAENGDPDPLVRAADYHEIATVSQPRVGPDGDRVAFVRTVPDGDEEYEATVYLVDVPGGEADVEDPGAGAGGDADPRQFTVAEGVDGHPRFSPSGDRLAFVSTRGADADRPQLWVLPTGGGEARRVTDVVGGVGSFAWSPAGDRIAFTQSAAPADREADRDLAVPDDHEPEPPDPRVIDRTIYRANERYFDGRRSGVYLLDLDGAAADGDPRRVTDPGDDRDFHGVDFGDADTLYYAPTPEEVPDPDDTLEFAVLARDLDSGTTDRVTTSTGWGADLAATDDGRVAYRYTPEDRAAMRQSELSVYDRAAGREHTPTDSLDRTLSVDASPEWDPDGEFLYFATPDRGSVVVRRVPWDGSADPEVVAGAGRHVDGAAPGPGVVAYTASDDDHPGDVFLARIGDGDATGGDGTGGTGGDGDGTGGDGTGATGGDGGAAGDRGEGPGDGDGPGDRRLTRVNRDYLAGRRLTDPEELAIDGPAGELQGWFLAPPEAARPDDGGEVPLVVEVHGGPHAMWSTAGTMFHEFHALAARGYAVCWCNPRGSTGYGEAFATAIERDWGSVTLADVEALVDACAARPGVDEGEVFLTGGSFGGYLTAWAVGRTDRFRAAVAQRGVYDLPAFYGTSDAYRLVEDDFGATPWSDPDRLHEHSPTARAHEVTTPTLLIHAEDDYRTPAATAEMFHRTLRKAGVETRLVRYPREGHELSRSGEPAHVVDRIERIARWFDGYSAHVDVPPAIDRDRNAGLSAGTDGTDGGDGGDNGDGGNASDGSDGAGEG